MVNKAVFGIVSMCIIIIAQSQFESFCKCGKPNPESEPDCTKYGTDSDFLCCYVKKNDGSAAVCALISYASANKIGVKGTHTDPATSTFYSCGNDSFFLKFSPLILGFIALLF